MAGVTIHHMGSAFPFDAGCHCLQFLAAPADLAGWAIAVLGVDAVKPMTLQESKDADTLSTAVRGVAVALARDRPVAIGNIARINRLANTRDLAPQVGPGGTLGWPSPVDHGQIIATVARDAVQLMTTADPAKIRQCAAEDCDLIFLDTSRPGVRRWCSMQRCGTRAKVRAHRARAAAS